MHPSHVCVDTVACTTVVHGVRYQRVASSLLGGGWLPWYLPTMLLLLSWKWGPVQTIHVYATHQVHGIYREHIPPCLDTIIKGYARYHGIYMVCIRVAYHGTYPGTSALHAMRSSITHHVIHQYPRSRQGKHTRGYHLSVHV